MKQGCFYITTTTPYVNADPHIGFALEIVAADVIARYHSLLGEQVVFNTGTDEHGLKIYRQAQEEKLTPQDFTDKYSKRFRALKELLDLSFTNFIRTTDQHHKQAAQEFWRRCDQNGDIYKKLYKIKYCVGCELEKTESELVENKCPIHPNKELEIIEEENYFFRFSRYQRQLLEFYKNNPQFVLPKEKYKEIVAFVEGGLQDFSISRLKAKMPWGIPVPGDGQHVEYVWFDALINYISTLGWPKDADNFEEFWPGVQIAGKDNLRQQAAMWQAMLMSAGLPTSEKILINGFISVDGQKMSKSLGNVISPDEMVKRYGIDGTRYLLMKLGSVAGDMDVSGRKFDATYNADLANGLGNFVNRVIGLVQRYCEGTIPDPGNDPDDHPLRVDESIFTWKEAWKQFDKGLTSFVLSQSLESIWKFLHAADLYIDRQKPWDLYKQGEQKKLNWVVYGLADSVVQLAWMLAAFLPEASKKIAVIFGVEKLLMDRPVYKDSWANVKPGTALVPTTGLFPRIDE